MRIPSSVLMATALLIGGCAGAAVGPTLNTGARAATNLAQGGTCTMTPANANQQYTCTVQFSAPVTSCVVQAQSQNPYAGDAVVGYNHYGCSVNGATVTVGLTTTGGSTNSLITFAVVAF